MSQNAFIDQSVASIVGRIEAQVVGVVNDMVCGCINGGFTMVQLSSSNIEEQQSTGALIFNNKLTHRKLVGRSALPVARMIAVLSVCHGLLISGTVVSQRELFYLMVSVFRNQRELNLALLEACATLGVPRYALNVGAATRGVVAGCILLGPSNSANFVDGQHVGTTGWPVPGDLAEVNAMQIQSHASFIVVIEKFGIFQRLCEDKFYNLIPCILLCGKGFPSVATRFLVSRMATQFKIPVMGLADYNPYGLALLQTYRRGGVRSSLEGSGYIADVRWLGIRSSHIQEMDWVTQGEPLTSRDLAIARNLRQQMLIANDPRYMAEVDAMEVLGKHELQCLYGHPEGLQYFSKRWLPAALLSHDYL